MSVKRPIRILLMTAIMISALLTYQPGEKADKAYALIPSGSASALDVMVDAEWRIWGDIETEYFGVSIAAGDLDGDGLGDLAVGIPHSSYGKVAGVVLLFFARDKDELMTINGFSDADVIIQGVDRNDRFGEQLAMIDLDGDGKSELIVSAPFADGIGNARRDCGEIYIISGKDRFHYGSMDGIENLTDWGHIIGRDAGDHQGMRMAFGDLNGDGILDLVLGSDGTGGTANSANESVGGSPWGENGVIGSWEIDVILGTGSMLGTHDIAFSGSRVRYYGGHINEIDIPTHIGNGLAVTDMDGDGHDDLVFSYRYDSEGWVVMSRGGPSFPYVAPDSSYVFPDPAPSTTNNPHPIFKPNLTISLGPDGFDEALLCAGNADGDAYSDLLVGMTGAPAWESRRHSAGQIDLYLGGTLPPSGRMDRTNATWTLFGEDASDRLGTSILMVDREKDGFDEFYIATPYSDGYQNTMDGAGEMYGFSFSGSFPRHSNVSDASLIMSGKMGYRSFSEITIMDMDGNGFPELVISSPGARSPEGTGSGLISLFGFDTSFEAMFYTEGDGWSAGSKVLFNDLDADGYPDLIISSPNGNDFSRGIVHIYFGSDRPWSGRYLDRTDADLYYEHRNPPAHNENFFGFHIATGDLDNDGYGDVVVYMTSNVDGIGDFNGAIYIFWGGPRAQMASKSFSPINGYSNARFGESFAIGDINGDGIDDLAVGAPDANTATTPSRAKGGRVHVWFGPLARVTRTATSSPLTIQGAMERDNLGRVMHVADLDGDGRSEIIMGTPNAKPGSITMQGAVYIVQGADTFPTQIDLANDDCLRIDGEWPYDGAGSFLETGDIDGDGKADLLISAPGADGYLRRTSNAGIVYVLQGSYLATKLPQGMHRLRRDVANITIYGSQTGETIGESVHLSDIDGDGRPEIALGSPTWFDRDSGKRPGAVGIIMEPQLLLGGSMNSSEIPKILGAGDGSRFGISIASALVDGDAKYDLVIGAPKYDFDGDGSPQGAAFLWLSKTVLPRDVKARTLEILNADMVLGTEDGPMAYISAENGPYMMRVEAWSSYGIASVREVSLMMMLQGGHGHILMTYYPGNGTFTASDSGAFRNRYRLDVASCAAESDGSMLYRVDFAFVPGWSMPLPEMIVTGIGTDFGSHSNFRSGLFDIDRSIRVDPASVVVADPEGGELPQWFNSTTPFVVTNVSLVHSVTGRRLSDDALGSLSFGLFRSDGFRIGTSKIVEGRLEFGPTFAGENITGLNAPFYISLVDPPAGSEWEDHIVPLNVDTYAPSAINSFTIYTDGKESGYRTIDDDPLVQVVWNPLNDNGHSGIDRYLIHIEGLDSGTLEVRDDISSGDVILIPEGRVRLGLGAVDRARNMGEIVLRDVLVDMYEPVFHTPTPADGSWLREGHMSLSVEVADNQSGLDLTSIKVRYYDAARNQLSAWLNPSGIMNQSGRILIVVMMPSYEGILNYVQYYAKDLSGREAVSRPIFYNIDLSLPRIVTGGPQVNWVTGAELVLSCEMSDGLSGLNLSSASYRFGPRDGFYNLPWQSLGYTGFGAAAYPRLEVEPSFSGWAYLQWRVEDMAGNAAESELEIYYIDRNMPVIHSITPDDKTVIGRRDVTVKVTLLDSESGISRTGVQYSVSRISDWIRYGIGGYSPWQSPDSVVEAGGGFYHAEFNVTLDDGDFNNVRIRVMDLAGNGWVESTPQRLRVSTFKENLPPVALFTMVPFVDVIYQGDELRLDASASYDPEGSVLRYYWYSDLESYPRIGQIGTGVIMNVSLNTTGVHRIWLDVSDGRNTVRSQEVLVRVLPAAQQDEVGGSGEGWDLWDIIPYVILALFAGILIGIFLMTVLRRRDEERMREDLPEPQLVDARVDLDFKVPHCPYCDADIRLSDTYCFTCGTMFSPEDIDRIMAGETSRPQKKGAKKRRELQKPDGESILPPAAEEEIPLEEEEIPLEGDVILDEEEFDELDELEELDEDDNDDLWEVKE